MDERALIEELVPIFRAYASGVLSPASRHWIEHTFAHYKNGEYCDEVRTAIAWIPHMIVPTLQPPLTKNIASEVAQTLERLHRTPAEPRQIKSLRSNFGNAHTKLQRSQPQWPDEYDTPTWHSIHAQYNLIVAEHTSATQAVVVLLEMLDALAERYAHGAIRTEDLHFAMEAFNVVDEIYFGGNGLPLLYDWFDGRLYGLVELLDDAPDPSRLLDNVRDTTRALRQTITGHSLHTGDAARL